SARWRLNADCSSLRVARSAIIGRASTSCCSAFRRSFSSSTRCSRSDATDAISGPPGRFVHNECHPMRINVRWMLAAATLLALAVPLAHSQAPAAATQHTFKQIAPGVYSAIAPPSLNGGSNSAVIVNQDDVLVVDSHMTPEAGRVLLQEIKTITNKPVRFLVDTHFHYDHTDGNQAFAPTADIIGHEYTRARLAAANYTTTGMLGNLLAGQSALAAQLKDLKPTPPNVTLSDHLTFWRGGREIRLLYLGRGHTGGDVVVYL